MCRDHPFDSFLWPLVQELLRLKQGVRAYDISEEAFPSMCIPYLYLWQHPSNFDGNAHEGT